MNGTRPGNRRGQAEAVDFHTFAAAGKKLAELHVGYEQQPEFPLRRRENPQSPLNWRVEKMRLSKDKTSLTYNDFLTLDGIPPETFEYRLGNRSALEWVIDQYQVSTDKRSGITNDPTANKTLSYAARSPVPHLPPPGWTRFPYSIFDVNSRNGSVTAGECLGGVRPSSGAASTE